MTCWSNYSRPILNIEYKIGPSDTIRIIGQDGAEKLNEVVYSHKCKIKTIFENRLDMLLKRYEERKTAKNRFLDFFKGSSPTEKHYVEEEAETREIADCLFLLEDYKQAYELYRVVAGKMTGRERRIEHNISEMVQQCLALGKYQGVRIK